MRPNSEKALIRIENSVQMLGSYRNNEVQRNTGYFEVFDMEMQISRSGTTMEESEAKQEG